MSVDEPTSLGKWRLFADLVEKQYELAFIGQLLPKLERLTVELATGSVIAVILPLNRPPAKNHDDLSREIVVLQDRETELAIRIRKLERRMSRRPSGP